MKQTDQQEIQRACLSPSLLDRANTTPTVQFDVSNLQSSHANVCNVSSTHEEWCLAFGVNNVWERGQANIHVQLTCRIVLNPFAAKRLAIVFTRVVTEYEADSERDMTMPGHKPMRHEAGSRPFTWAIHPALIASST